MHERPTAKPERYTDMAGTGCLIQTIGLLAPVIGLLFGPPGIIVGLIVMVALFVAGSSQSQKWRCSACKNVVPSKHVTVCPACGQKFQR